MWAKFFAKSVLGSVEQIANSISKFFSFPTVWSAGALFSPLGLDDKETLLLWIMVNCVDAIIVLSIGDG